MICFKGGSSISDILIGESRYGQITQSIHLLQSSSRRANVSLTIIETRLGG